MALESRQSPYKTLAGRWHQGQAGGGVPQEREERHEYRLDSTERGLLASRGAGFRVQLGAGEELLKKLLAAWEISSDQAVAVLGLEGNDARTHVQRVLLGFEKLERDERRRVAILFDIYQYVHSLLRVRTAEMAFLRHPQPAFNGDSIRDVILEGSIDRLQSAREFVQGFAGF